MFDGNPGAHTVRLSEAKQDKLQETLHKWTKHAGDGSTGIPFSAFEKTIT